MLLIDSKLALSLFFFVPVCAGVCSNDSCEDVEVLHSCFSFDSSSLRLVLTKNLLN